MPCRDVMVPVLRKDGVQGAPLALDDLAGMIYLPALFACPERLAEGDLGLSDVLEDPVVSPPNFSVAELMDRLQDAGQEIAVVCDGAAIRGFVTITEALEVITGEVEDPMDRRGA